jgi:Cro/C1-type HTH DNA-binding domain
MVQAYSQLRRVLAEQKVTIPELQRRMEQQGLRVNLKSLYRLSDDRQPLHRLDLRVAGAICQHFQMSLAELIAFEKPGRKLRRLAGVKQKRLDTLMARNNEGMLTDTEQAELQTLAQEAEEIMLDNARILAGQRQQVAST